MGAPSYVRSVVDRNVVVRRIPVCTSSTYVRYEKFTKNFNAITRDTFTQWEDNTQLDILEIRLICPSFGSSCVRL